jgi:flagellar motor switch protein FliM
MTAPIPPQTVPPAALRLFERSRPSVAELPALRTLLEDYARACSGILERLVGCGATIVLERMRCGPAENDGATGSGLVVVCPLPDLGGVGYCSFERLLLFRVLDAMCGGDPLVRVEAPQRGLTALERKLAVRLGDALMQQLAASFGELCPFSAEPCRLAEDADLTRMKEPGPDILVAHLRVVGWQGVFFAAIPSAVLDNARDRLGAGSAEPERDLDPSWSEVFRACVSKTVVSIEASAAGPAMLLSDVARLGPGSVLPLAVESLQQIVVHGAAVPVFRGRLGQAAGALSICLESPASGFMPADDKF